MKRKIAFIVNPSAGTKKTWNFQEFVSKDLPKHLYFEIIHWTNKNNFEEIKQKILSTDYTELVAVGGDGTVNEVARVGMEKGIPIGIIPAGSGNGLARSLGIPMNFDKALKLICDRKTRLIDVGFINDTPFLCTSGVGFDAHIGKLFASRTQRGLLGYVKITLKELFTYRTSEYRITINETAETEEAFLITFANAGQYGNNFYIAPMAKVDDGLLHVAIVKPFPFFSLPLIFLKIVLLKAHKSRFIKTLTADKLTIRSVRKTPFHFDGEPGNEAFEFEVKVRKKTLEIITG
jgi:diacylglycerol kinase (ATP)